MNEPVDVFAQVGLFAKEEYILKIYLPGETQTDHYGLFMGGDGNLFLAMVRPNKAR